MASIDELWIVDFGDPYPGEPAASRPALVIGPPDTFGADFPYGIVVPLTTTGRGLSLHVEIEPLAHTGLDQTSYAQCELIRSINRRRFVHRIGQIDTATSNHVTMILRTLLNH